MKKLTAKLFPNKGLKKFVVLLNDGSSKVVRAKDFEVTYFTGSGVCASIKFTGHRKRAFFAPSSVSGVIQK